jgi:hypothetical protein
LHARIQTHRRRRLARPAQRQARQLDKQPTGGGFADARDGQQQLPLALQFRMGR